ncbi:2-dehydro-3-deoxy-D-gluconate 5-dehydrogenase KduD [Halobacillus shinanisalinarum]|uniref:2-dehydro-3-deoxy-D-gluconate 5-dehydrogenase KduD n=1 Tax=Halobacillus shinanisalinarum TaxID=2932258 RepID=A0ABY4H147_9BACI|nr:2-dehydro-3-deoxy-D-gluconate 5-dehydrogenase KduD [Halobacillus shinanisalinarum]UOQ93362.1 2-dehydro-3-deoxy-D-gluconate 5-dehydrogenase KduD [Halobacillus shinanisalinarum]
MNQLFDLTGKVAVVTGGNRGLGKDIAAGLAESGADVVVVARNVKPEVVKELHRYGVNAKGINFDLQHTEQFDDLVSQIIEEFGKVDILVNNAGVQKRHPSVDFPKEDWDFVMNINTNAVFLLCQKFGRRMIQQGSGKIINMASMLSFHGGFTVPAYAASKGAVMQFTKSLANEWAEQGVNVNAIAPGYMATEMNTALIDDETRNKEILNRIPAKRWGEPKDLRGAAVFLASPASDYIHGFTLAVDGGYLGR